MAGKTLAAMTQNNWAYGGSTGYARYEFSDDFVDEDGREFEAGPNSYLEVATTIAGGIVTVPAYPNFPTTESAVLNNGVTVTCHLLDSNRVKRTTLFEDCRIYTSLPSTISLSQLVLANGASRLLRDTDVWTKEQVIDYINTLPPAVKMTALVHGIARLASAAADPADPIVIGSNDPRLSSLPNGISPATGARIIYANQLSGVDAAAKINAADALLGADAGTIVYLGGGTIGSAQIVISPKHTLYLGTGTYSPGPTALSLILMKEDSALIGDGPGRTIILEPTLDYPADPQAVFNIIIPFGQYNSNGTTTRNLVIRDLELRGNRSDFGSVRGAIDLGNCHTALVENVKFNTTHAIGISIGGSSVGGTDTLALGRYAENVTVRNCEFYQVASQNIAPVNCKNSHIIHNRIIMPGQTGGPSLSAIDVETNLGTDFAENLDISHNIIDVRLSPVSVNGIAWNASTQNGPAIIASNLIIGRTPGGTAGNLSNGVVLTGTARDITIRGNQILGATQSGISAAGVRLAILSNNLTDCGTNGAAAGSIAMIGVTASRVMGNVLYSPDAGYLDSIIESSGSTGNRYGGNSVPGGYALLGTSVIEDNIFGPTSAVTISGNVNNYDLSPFSLFPFMLKIDGGAADRTISGLIAGAAGQKIQIHNGGTTNNLTLVSESASSSAANRFALPASLVLPPNATAEFRYDDNSSRWRLCTTALPNSGVTAGAYTYSSVTVGADGRVTSASSGTVRTPLLWSTGGSGVTKSATTYLTFGAGALNATEGVRQIPMPFSGTLRNLRVQTLGSQGNGTLVVTLRKNGVDTAITFTISASAAVGVFSDLVNSVSVVAGDLISVKCVNNASDVDSTFLSMSAELDD